MNITLQHDQICDRRTRNWTQKLFSKSSRCSGFLHRPKNSHCVTLTFVGTLICCRFAVGWSLATLETNWVTIIAQRFALACFPLNPWSRKCSLYSEANPQQHFSLHLELREEEITACTKRKIYDAESTITQKKSAVQKVWYLRRSKSATKEH